MRRWNCSLVYWLPRLSSYAKALTGFKAAGPAARGGGAGKPRFPGECALTRIEAVTTRFGEPVSYDNAATPSGANTTRWT